MINDRETTFSSKSVKSATIVTVCTQYIQKRAQFWIERVITVGVSISSACSMLDILTF